jgi:hypothetical protein
MQINTRNSARSMGTNINKQGEIARALIKKKPADPRIIISIRAKARLNKPETYMLYLALYKNIKDLIIKRCYEHARDQGTLGSVAGCRHSRTPGGTYGFLIRRGWPRGRPSSPRGSSRVT